MRIPSQIAVLAATILFAAPTYSQNNDFVHIPAGSFIMGDHSGLGSANELPLHQVSLSSFYMQRTEVSVDDFCQFLSGLGGRVYFPSIYDDNLDLTAWPHETVAYVLHNFRGYGDYSMEHGWGFFARGTGIENRATHAVSYVSWYGAVMYANWLSIQEGYSPVYDETTWAADYTANGYRLPTEAEWEYAARGNAPSYDLYPWGNSISGYHANSLYSGDPWSGSSIVNTAPVGYYSNWTNGFGLHGMIGNVSEMCTDYYDPNYYSYSPSLNPMGPATGTTHSIRGGSHTDNRANLGLRSADRNGATGDYIFWASGAVGFRLVMPEREPILSVTNFLAGEDAVVSVTQCSPLRNVAVAYSFSGAGPTQSPFGLADLSQPVQIFPILTSDSSGVASITISIPGTALDMSVWLQAVDLFQGVLSNSLAEVVESNGTPSLTSVSPNTLNQGGSATVTVYGTDFSSNCTVYLESAATSVGFTNLQFISTTEMSGDIDLVGASEGLWTVVVEKSNGETGALLNGFTVLPVTPVVSSCSPFAGLENTTVEVTVYGDFIDQGATVDLVMGATTLTGMNAITSSSGQTITADFDLIALPGFYDVVVTDPNGSSGVLIAGFEVLNGSAYATFEMGNHGFFSGDGDETPVHTVTVIPVDVDDYECTNSEYAAYLNSAYTAGDVTVTNDIVYDSATSVAICDTVTGTAYSSITFNGSTFGVVTGEDQFPVCKVSWYGAVTYANWRSVQDSLTPCYDTTTWNCTASADGWRLPSEAEWEYASRGASYSPYYAFPWDTNIISSTDANYGNNLGDTCAVGLYAPNAYGLYDMGGNVREWTNDWYSWAYYATSPTLDPRGPSTGTQKAVRGGGWNSFSNGAGVTNAGRDDNYPADRASNIGFRLVKNL